MISEEITESSYEELKKRKTIVNERITKIRKELKIRPGSRQYQYPKHIVEDERYDEYKHLCKKII